jgi:metal-responsive CopG/Arc/MetJ family transcriptional regulator
MPRTILQMPDEQLRRLDTLVESMQVSRAEAVRVAIDEFIAARSRTTESFGSWKGKTSVAALDKSLRGRW